MRLENTRLGGAMSVLSAISVSRIKLGAIFVGWITTWFLLFLMAMSGVVAILLSSTDLEALPTNFGQGVSANLLVFLLVFAAFFAGGYVAGRMASFAGGVNGIMVMITSGITITFAVLFVAIVGRNLGIDILEPISKAISPYMGKVVAAAAFGLVGSVLGGRYGEGYVDRLQVSIQASEQKKEAAETTETTQKTAKRPQGMPAPIKSTTSTKGKSSKKRQKAG